MSSAALKRICRHCLGDKAAALASITVFAGMVMASSALHAQSASSADLDALVKAAKAEGEVVFYCSATENVAKRIADSFTAKYGIKAQFLRMGSGPLLQRYASEAQSGIFAADFIFNSSSLAAFVPDGIRNGWLEPVEKAGLPVVESGQFPAKFFKYGSAVVQVAPWTVTYNTDSVKAADVPKAWKDLIGPRFKGRILLADPKSADSYLDEWALLIDTYGPSFLTAVRAQNPRWFVDGVPALQALAAGEGDLEFPIVGYAARALIDKGAPLATTVLDPDTGIEMAILVTNRTKAKHPNAARLFAQYVMTPEGNKVFNADPDTYSVYGDLGLPKDYSSPKPDTVSRKDEIRKLLGLP